MSIPSQWKSNEKPGFRPKSLLSPALQQPGNRGFAKAEPGRGCLCSHQKIGMSLGQEECGIFGILDVSFLKPLGSPRIQVPPPRRAPGKPELVVTPRGVFVDPSSAFSPKNGTFWHQYKRGEISQVAEMAQQEILA